MIYKVISISAWQQWQQDNEDNPHYGWLGEGIDVRDQYIHCSTQEQLANTLKLYFAQRQDILLLALNENDEQLDVRWEASRNHLLFPHIYSALHMHHVQEIYTLSLDQAGQHTLPISLIQ